MNYSSIEITFKNGFAISFDEGEWDDYSYDGKFFSIRLDGVNVAMYNATDVFSVVLS